MYHHRFEPLCDNIQTYNDAMKSLSLPFILQLLLYPDPYLLLYLARGEYYLLLHVGKRACGRAELRDINPASADKGPLSYARIHPYPRRRLCVRKCTHTQAHPACLPWGDSCFLAVRHVRVVMGYGNPERPIYEVTTGEASSPAVGGLLGVLEGDLGICPIDWRTALGCSACYNVSEASHR
jgi:hypothetical protein